MDVWKAVVLGIVQGATEWLPVSSSGHLAIMQRLLGESPPLLFDILLHVGTLAAVLTFFREDVGRLVRAFLSLTRDVFSGNARDRLSGDPSKRLALLILVGSVPIGVLGFLLEPMAEASYWSMAFVGGSLVLTGVFMYPTRVMAGKRDVTKIGGKDAIWIGLAQAVSVFPGISRSGFTISAGLYLGLDRKTAARFSFLLSIPAILGATLYELSSASLGAVDVEAYMIVGMMASAVVGYLTIWPVIAAVRGRKLEAFSYYCWAVGALLLLWFAGVF